MVLPLGQGRKTQWQTIAGSNSSSEVRGTSADGEQDDDQTAPDLEDRALGAMKSLETSIPNLLAQPSLTESASVNKLTAKDSAASGTALCTLES